MKLELLPVPVSDIDAAIDFYVEKLGFNKDHDTTVQEGVRIVQLTPEGSSCSIVLSTGLPMVEMPVGTQRGIHLVVDDVEEARQLLLGKDIEAGDVVDTGGVRYVPFSDLDGNQWTFQDFKKSN